MQIITNPVEMRAWSERTRRAGQKLALVPTMGYFHEGHLSLMRFAVARADSLVVSIFVNPIQFAAGEDLKSYPSNRQRDRKLATTNGVNILFCPDLALMYPENFQTTVTVTGVSDSLCGRSRPGHFAGVATVVAKLFNIVRPDLAIFGEKDFQQLAVIRTLVRDLNLDIVILGHPIVREADGLAMSSRNIYLSSQQRQAAPALAHSLKHAGSMVKRGERRPDVLRPKVAAILTSAGLEPEYIEFVDESNLKPVTAVGINTILALAAHCGSTRLIDNCRFG
ncbi:MAG: pantoate--beta-alanine ligase [Desulfobulbaceae bacterium]|nr:MAG: pantoate--beta-alanine ligase [Desulfobulbaceae bacterium]